MAAIAAAIEALEGDWTRMVALMDALRKRAAAVRARVQAHSVKLSEVEDSVLTDITERSLQVDLGTNKTIFQQLLSALTSARRAVQACMAGCGLNLRVAESDARPKMGSCQHAAADVVSFAASACYLEKASCQDLRVRDIILDRLDVRVQAAVHPRLFLPVPPYLLASPCTPQCTQRSKGSRSLSAQRLSRLQLVLRKACRPSVCSGYPLQDAAAREKATVGADTAAQELPRKEAEQGASAQQDKAARKKAKRNKGKAAAAPAGALPAALPLALNGMQCCEPTALISYIYMHADARMHLSSTAACREHAGRRGYRSGSTGARDRRSQQQQRPAAVRGTGRSGR